MSKCGLNNCKATMKGKKVIKMKDMIPDNNLRKSIVSQEITSDFVLEIYEKAKKARTKKRKEELHKVAEVLSKNVGKWLIE